MKQCALCQEEIEGRVFYFKKESYCQNCYVVIKEIRKQNKKSKRSIHKLNGR